MPVLKSIVRVNGKTTTISEMSPSELAANLTEKQRSEIAAKLGIKTSPEITSGQLQAAVNKAQVHESERWAAVFASEHSKGRERVCVSLLSNARRLSAAQIIAQLRKSPTDDTVNSEAQAQRAKAVGSIWEAAVAANHPGHKPG